MTTALTKLEDAVVAFVDKIKSDLKALTTNVGTIDTPTLEGQITSVVDTHVATLQADIDALKTSESADKTNETDLAARVADLENAMVEIKGHIDAGNVDAAGATAAAALPLTSEADASAAKDDTATPPAGDGATE